MSKKSIVFLILGMFLLVSTLSMVQAEITGESSAISIQILVPNDLSNPVQNTANCFQNSAYIAAGILVLAIVLLYILYRLLNKKNKKKKKK